MSTQHRHPGHAHAAFANARPPRPSHHAIKIARDNAGAILLELKTLGFKPAGKDALRCRILERRNQDGHTDLQVVVNFDDENNVNDISVRGFDGGAAELVDWSMDVTGGAPLDALLAFVRNA